VSITFGSALTLGLGLALTLTACRKGPDAERAAVDTAAASTTAAAAPDSAAAGDQEFLRQMSDHHHGMVTMAHEAMEKTGSAVQQEATAIDQKQDEEVEEMLDILLKDYSDPHSPAISPDAQAMIDALASKSGTDYDRTFRMNVIEHHKQGIAMIDRFRPRLTREDVRSMAQRMKTDQEQEIRELQAKLGG
jgi:uncharacterized protein (DUF305 family)